MAARYSDSVHFLVVYIREAHPEEGWILPENRRSGIAVHEAVTDDERREVASICAVNLKISMPIVVDTVDNAVASSWHKEGLSRASRVPGRYTLTDDRWLVDNQLVDPAAPHGA